jgi:predicted GTPase/FtsZ-binding cell division protein ZapB
MSDRTNFSQYLNSLQEKKQALLQVAERAAEYGWIPKERTTSAKDTLSLAEIREKLEKDTLTIGVIGQMKCGKSTFLNAFIFENDVLPAATTPMTAALSVITYGEKERIVAEFYTADEWAEQKMQAARPLEDAVDSLDESKIKAAKELVEKSSRLGTSLQKYLGTTQEDSFDQLIEYVGADGKFISITKSVTIYYPKEYLKGVEIVDTPGFNDPIVSREERTKEFLKKADVVLMMLYAGRPFDATDRDIIFKNVRQCGIGKVLIGINKYDIPYCCESNPEDEQQIRDYVKAEIRKACKACQDNTLTEILSTAEPIPVSAEMALLAAIPTSRISENEAFDFAWKRHCSNFGISTAQEMHQWSHIDDLTNAVKELIDKEKGQILFAKPLNAILAAGNKIKTENENELHLINNKIELLQMPDSEVEEREDKLARVHKRLQKKINSLGEELDANIQNLIRKGKYDMEDEVDSSCKRMKEIVHRDWSRFKSFDSIRPRIDNEIQFLITRTLKRKTEELAEQGKRVIKRSINTFFQDAESLLMQYLPDFDSKDFIESTQNKIHLDMDDNDLFSFKKDDDNDTNYGWGDVIWDVLNGASWGLLGVIGNILSYDENLAKVEDFINSISRDFDPSPYLDHAFMRKDAVIDSVKEAFITDLIKPLQEQIEDIRTKRNQKESELKNAQRERDALETKKGNIRTQIDEMNKIKATLV